MNVRLEVPTHDLVTERLKFRLHKTFCKNVSKLCSRLNLLYVNFPFCVLVSAYMLLKEVELDSKELALRGYSW